MKCLSISILLTVVIAYIFVGGLIFHKLERAEQEETDPPVIYQKKDFLGNVSCVSEEEFAALVARIISVYNRTNGTTQDNWNYVNSVFFAVTVITTIGYGHVAPSTNWSRLWCMCYAVCGIPMFLVLIGAIGHKISGLFQRMHRKYCTRQGCAGLLQSAGLHTAAIITPGAIIISLPALAFKMIEGWSFSDACYFCVVSLTTIGFGDFVPGFDNFGHVHPVYMWALMAWLIIGLSWVSSVFSYGQKLYEVLFRISDEHVDITERHCSCTRTMPGVQHRVHREENT